MSDDVQAGASPEDLADEALLTQLGDVLSRVDPPPTWLVDLAKLSYDLRSIDAELAELVADSRLDEPAVAVRADPGLLEPRLLTFETDDLVVDLELTPERDGFRMHGQLVPAQPARIELRQPDRPTRSVPVDDLGRFTVDGLSAGPFSLVCHREDGRPVASSWVTSD